MADMKEPSDGCSLGKEEVDVCEREVQRKRGEGEGGADGLAQT